VQPVVALSIAGSDSGGGAGIQADLRTFAALGVHGTTAITALTAQNTLGVNAIEAASTSMVLEQIEAVTSDFVVAAVKTGMLATPSIVALVAAVADRGRLPRLVVDPVLVSTSNHLLMADGGVEAYRDLLLPQAYLVTPNLREAAVLAGVDAEDVRTSADLAALGRLVLAFGSTHVYMKGGHLRDEQHAPDFVLSHDGVLELSAARVATTNDHGTGCSLSAALCAELAKGADLNGAAATAKTFVHRALESASQWQLGRGRGPINHLNWSFRG
jgi:hydroxymethylpyrimidine/phosphomethylpyrimidine kinase